MLTVPRDIFLLVQICDPCVDTCQAGDEETAAVLQRVHDEEPREVEIIFGSFLETETVIIDPIPFFCSSCPRRCIMFAWPTCGCGACLVPRASMTIWSCTNVGRPK